MAKRELEPVRGRVYLADLGHGAKPWLAVSNNSRNRALPDFLAVRITSTPKPPLITIVELAHGDPLTGRVLCDDLETLTPQELTRDVGALSRQTMAKVDAGLRVALGL